MLFSSIVFMSKTLRGQWISVVLVFVFKLDIASNAQILNDYTERFDGDFDNFLKEMGTMVYKGPKTDERQNEVQFRHETQTQPLPLKYWKKKNTPKAIIEDVLMMKLVSYYEDKYKLSHLEPTTTESITLKFDGNRNGKMMLNAATKNNVYKYNIIDNEEVPSYRKPTKLVQNGSNRRKQRDKKRVNEYREPEVVIF